MEYQSWIADYSFQLRFSVFIADAMRFALDNPRSCQVDLESSLQCRCFLPIHARNPGATAPIGTSARDIWQRTSVGLAN